MSDATVLDPLLEEFYPVWLRFHPEFAPPTEEGDIVFHPAALDDDDVGALMALLESFIVALEELDFSGLDADRRMDLRLAFGSAQIEHCELLTRDWRHRDPLRFLPVRTLHELTLKRPSRFERLELLLEQVPSHLRYARTQLTTLPALVNRICLAAALEEAEAGIPFLRQLAGSPLVPKYCRDPGQFREACHSAAHAVESYRDFLLEDLAPVASGGLGVGTEHYLRLLRQRHFLSLGLERLRARLETLADGLEERAVAKAVELLGEPSLERLAAALARVQPLSGRERVEQCERDCARLARIARERDWLTLPEEPLRVTEKSSCLRPGLGEIDYLAPSLPDAPAGRLLLPPLAPGAEESRLRILVRAVEAGPLGLHLLENRSLAPESRWPRRVHRSAGMRGGWRFHVHRLLAAPGGALSVEEGAALSLVNLAAARLALLDLDLHTQDLSYQAAAQRLRSIPGFPEGRADTELTRLSRHPADRLASAVGGLLIEYAQEAVCMGPDALSLRGFHDRLLGCGQVPLPLIIHRQFGETLWRQVLDQAVG